MFSTIWEAVLLVAVVCPFFPRNWRAMLVPLVTILVSLVGAFTLMLVLGFDQHAHAARGAGDRAGGGRCDRGAGEHLPPHRGRHGTGRRRLQDQGDRLRVAAMTITLAAVYAPVAS